MSDQITPMELREFKARSELEAFYLLSVEDAVRVLSFLLQSPAEGKDDADGSAHRKGS